MHKKITKDEEDAKIPFGLRVKHPPKIKLL